MVGWLVAIQLQVMYLIQACICYYLRGQRDCPVPTLVEKVIVNERPLKTLYQKLKSKGYLPEHVAEVGVYMPETSNIYDYIIAGIQTTLVEPDPESIRRIEDSFGHLSNVTLHRVASYDHVGVIALSQRDASTFVSQLESSPAIVNDGYVVSKNDQFSVECTTFDKIDDGTIDLLSIDTEGSEWFVLKYLKSRPDVISIETHGAAYVNPHIDNIEHWMRTNNYSMFYKDNSDSVYVLTSKVKLSSADALALHWKNIMLAIRRFRKLRSRG